jgi:hypothetical protein
VAEPAEPAGKEGFCAREISSNEKKNGRRSVAVRDSAESRRWPFRDSLGIEMFIVWSSAIRVVKLDSHRTRDFRSLRVLQKERTCIIPSLAYSRIAVLIPAESLKQNTAFPFRRVMSSMLKLRQ